MKFWFRLKRIPLENGRKQAKSFIDRQDFRGLSVFDPEHILNGLLFRFWFRPLHLSLMIGFTFVVTKSS